MKCKTTTEQINIFDELERENHEEKLFQVRKSIFEKWLAMPDIVHVGEDDPERRHVPQMLCDYSQDLYSGVYHECPQLPNDKYIWLNYCASLTERRFMDDDRFGVFDSTHAPFEYWVVGNKNHCGESKNIAECPYCGAKLSDGKGSVKMYKVEARRWSFFLHWEMPIKLYGQQSENDKRVHDLLWGWSWERQDPNIIVSFDENQNVVFEYFFENNETYKFTFNIFSIPEKMKIAA